MNVTVENPVYIYGDPDVEKPYFEAHANSGVVTWASSAGTMTVFGGGGEAAQLNPPNQTRSIIVTATDTGNGQQVSGVVQVWARFPLHAYFPHDADIGQRVDYSQSEDATPESEQSSVRGTEYIVFNYVALDRALSDYKLIRDFRRANVGLYFYYIDRAAEETLYCRFDSDIRRKANQFEHFDLTFVLRGRIVYNAAPDDIGSAG